MQIYFLSLTPSLKFQAMDNRGCTLMSNDFTATWLERKIPYSSMYTSDFDQKYPKASNLPSGTEKLQKRNWETAFYGMYINNN